MLRHLGYMAEPQSIDACTSRTCRPGEATPGRIRSMLRDNLRDLSRVLLFNAEHGIGLHRVSSRVIPFASGPGHEVAWWDEFSGALEEIGQLVRRSGLRLEMHPGHHCLLNAPSPETMALSILELGWHVRFLDALQLDASHKLVVRVGGTFGDKGLSLARFVSVVNGLPDGWKSRLVIENDDARYDEADVLEASGRSGLPVAFRWVPRRPGPPDDRDLAARIARCFDTWKPTDGVPVVHLAGPPRGFAGRTSDFEWVEPRDFASLLALLPDDAPFDCLLEASQGDRALFDLRERMVIREWSLGTRRSNAYPTPVF